MARRTATAAGVILSHLEFDLLWEDLGPGGPPPYPFDVPAHGATHAERDDLGVRVFAGLTEAGLTDGDAVDPGLADLFVLLGAPALSVDALVLGEAPWRLLAAVRGPAGVLAVLDERDLVLEPMRAADLVPAVTRMLGSLPPGPGEQLRLPRAAYATAMNAYAQSGYDAFERALGAAGITGRSIRPLATLVTAERYAAGQLAATGPAGRTPVLAWFDTAAGRYAVTPENVGGEPWVMVTPADDAWFADRVTRLTDDAR
ncbi:ESX secretion-associated protein EspG [Amycolatopsis sp. WQ 127309]|uniref:ESX secretion-associated protein EspG n=1 Tax=Amycolatopsis sp. WQ 127309 TaxID=2932773 RepID=UPI001FF4A107|nr:ESX secretion-associated protein EspG [Amycolatopsis sp. WQ 127309]UOZ05206.1 ESX secretion-associated protein EspG [Amycolatopsis sp. WQ 127309]